MPEVGQEIEGYGLRLRFVTLDPGMLCMDASYSGEGGMPPEHLHPSQDEHFHVLEGVIETVVDGKQRRYQAGEDFLVPAGTPHRMAADGGPARVRWEVRPALRTAEFFERLYSGEIGESIERFLAEYSDEIQLTGDGPPAAA